MVVEEESDAEPSFQQEGKANEYQLEDDEESIVIKKPNASQKSKSLENINKKNCKVYTSSKAIIELYKQ